MICGLHINAISRELVLASSTLLHNLLFSCNGSKISGVLRRLLNLSVASKWIVQLTYYHCTIRILLLLLLVLNGSIVMGSFGRILMYTS